MRKRRLEQIEQMAARMLTMSEFAEMLRLIFSTAERTCNAEDVAAFKREVLQMVARDLALEIEDLRAMV